jgi:hypothetical protein
MRGKNITAVAVLALLVGTGAFYGGTIYEKSSLTSQGLLRDRTNGQFQGQGGQRRGPGGMGPGGVNGGAGDFTAGDITAKDDKSITLKTRDGSSKIIYFSDSTSVGKAVSGGLTDLATGEQVTVSGKNNPDGSLSAQNIQIRPTP